MKQSKNIGQEYNRCMKRINEIRSKGTRSRQDEEELAVLQDRAESLMTEIKDIRSKAVNRYVTRTDFRSEQNGCMEQLRRRAAYYRFCKRAADRAKRSGKRSEADSWEKRAKSSVDEMEKIRKSSKRTIDTPCSVLRSDGDGSLLIRRPGTGQTR